MSLWMSNNTELEKHIEFSYVAGEKSPVELLDDCAYAIHVQDFLLYRDAGGFIRV